MHVIQSRLTLFFAAAVSFLIAFALLSRAAHGDDTPAPQTVSASAGNVSPALAPALPDPIDRPVEFVEELKPAREYGGIHVLVLLVVAALARSLVKRIAPVEGSPPATGWRGKSVMVLSTIAVLVGSLLDLLLGSLTGVGFGVVAAAGGLAVQDSRNKAPGAGKGARSPVAPLSALLVLLVLSSCATVRHAGAAGAAAGLDCQAPSLQAAVLEAAGLAKALVISKISGSGEVDADGLREAARALKSEGLRCALVGAIAAVADAMQGREQTIRPLFAPPPVDLRALGRSIAAEEWGLSGPLLVEGGAL